MIILRRAKSRYSILASGTPGQGVLIPTGCYAAGSKKKSEPLKKDLTGFALLEILSGLRKEIGKTSLIMKQLQIVS